jgi:predicted dehydrogenase
VPVSTQAPTGPVTAPPSEQRDFSGSDTLNAELTAFAQSIAEKTPYPVPLADVLHGMAVFDAAVESARRKTIVAVGE